MRFQQKSEYYDFVKNEFYNTPKKKRDFKLNQDEIWSIMVLLTIACIVLTCILIYDFKSDVLYKIQFQVPIITKRYFWLDSNSFCCLFLFIAFFCVWRKKWWISLISLIFLVYCYKWYNWLHPIDVYKCAYMNCIVWMREAFNYELNIYIYKSLSREQVDWVLNLELERRLNAVSFLVYWECRPFWLDPFIDHFFDNFVFDYTDCWNYERVRNQIDTYQKYNIEIARMELRAIIAENITKYRYEIFWDNTIEFLINHPADIVFCMFGALIVGVILYYHLVENPFYYRFFPAIEEVEEVEEVKEKALTLIDELLRTTGRLPSIFKCDNEVLMSNLHYVLTQNQAAIKAASNSLQNLPPEVVQRAVADYFPSIIGNQQVAISILENLDKQMNNSPFEQFEVLVLQRISLFGLDFSFSNLTLYLVLAFVVIIFFFSVIKRSLALVPNYWQSVVEIFYSFIFSMLVDQAGKKAKVFFPAIFSLFFFILVSNLLGLIPLSFAVTSHVVITFCLGFGFFVAWIIVAFKTIGLKLFAIFWPTNVPLWLRPLLMVVEILSFSLRPLSLSIRLFVNILAGHILLHLVAGSVVLVFSKAVIFSFIPFVLLLAVFCLELGIAFLQAYIFSILLCIYLHDSFHVHGH